MMNNMSQGLGSFNNMMPQNNMMQQNPYGQQMNPQMMGQQMTSPEMFSEQLMAPNQMAPMQDPMQGLQPMSQPEGFGVYGQSLEGYADGGEAVPRETEIMGQPHMLAYINPEEEMMLRQMGGAGEPGPGGVPSYFFSAIRDFFSSEPTPSEPRGNPAASGERLQTAMAEQKAEKDERPTTIKGALTQAFDDVKMGIGALAGKETTPGYKERSRLSLANAQEIEKKRQRDDDKDARRAAAAAPVATTATGTGIDTIPIEEKREPNELELSMESTKTQAQRENEARAAGQEMYMFMGNYYKVNPVMQPSGPVEQTIVEQTMPEVGSPNAVVPVQPVPEPINTQVPAATVDPMTPVGGDFLLPGQQNFGPTPAAALNFNPNTYMQTPQNASVALPEMFQQSKPYTFEELLSMYKPAYEPIL